MSPSLQKALSVIILFLIPATNFAQSPPTLGTASSFVMFTASGAFSNDGESFVIGDVGTNVGAFNAFPPGTVVGQIHVADPVSATAATDVDVAYSYLANLTCGQVIGTTLGNGQVLSPDVYCMGAATVLNGDLILDGGGDSDALFIFKIDGALSTSTFANVILLNTSPCNVYWQVNGAFILGDSSNFVGTLLVNGAISLLQSSTLIGRGLSRGGAIDLHNNIITLETDCGGCSVPMITSVDSVCGNVASMCWTSTSTATSYIVRWNILPDSTWIYTTILAPDTCREFTNRFGDVNQLQVAAVCANGDTSAFSPLVTFTDYLVCAAPTGLTSSNVTATSANLSWTANPDANKYAVLYKVGANKTTVKLSGTSLSLTNLPPSTKIQWKVKSRCNTCDNEWGTYSHFKTFTTGPLKQFTLDQPSSGSLTVFPNPANVNFTVSFNIGYSSQQSYTIAVLDILGQQVMTEAGTLTDGLLSKDVSLTNGISNGIYFITITTGGKQFREPLIVNKD